ncbi:DUF6529 family protein [Streptacidiphilus jiangxiensis]|uniref:Cytochrome b561 n=1 Tax=Streptacidiphilus jiangxiensis TaxID=235985 RepID=A0A1H7H4R8_STRJI|nr:DUF6529 family protein [Streptacidiphilus jiangxiensis]SEK44737.1 hypothetical protein SAMN05414137_10258 [Streptacidiphilus jiangxiensis]
MADHDPAPRSEPPSSGSRAAGGRAVTRLATAGVLALVVFGALFAFGRNHTPDYNRSLFGNAGVDAVALKAQLATGILGLALLQLALALWMYRRLPAVRGVPRAVPLLHRLLGLLLFAATIPVAVHCVLAYGVQLSSPRVAVHAVAGCLFYGAFAAKVLLVHSRRLPGWALPVVGGLLLVCVGALWYSAALWYLNDYHLPGS